MQRSVVCGVDGSEPSNRALSTAQWLTKQLAARLVVVHVAAEPAKRVITDYGSYASASDAAEERGNLVLAQALHRPDLPRRLARRVELGDPAERLASAAGDEDAALVVVGSRGSGPLRAVLLGGVSRRLVTTCDRPVVVVPKDAEVPGSGRAVRSLVCGVDRSEASDRAVAIAAALASALELRLVIAHVYAPVHSQASIPASSGVLPVDFERLRQTARHKAVEVLDRAERVIAGAGPVSRRLVAGDPAGRLAELATRERAAMLILGPRAQGAVKAAVLGSVSTAVLGSAPVPVVIVTAAAGRGGPRARGEAPGRPVPEEKPGMSVTGSAERRLLLRYQSGDVGAREELVHRFIPLAQRLAARYRHTAELQEDLEQVAALGLIKAIDRYDPEFGSFVPYAVPTIMGELKRHFRDKGWGMRVPRSVQERFLQVNETIDVLSGELGRSPTPKDIAEHTGICIEDVLEALEASAAYAPAALDGPGARTDDDERTLGDSVGAEDRGYRLVELGEALTPAFRALPARERAILKLRFADDLTQSEIAEQVGISQMHVSRLLRRSLDRLAAAADGHRAPPA